jgi:hypothetical protein
MKRVVVVTCKHCGNQMTEGEAGCAYCATRKGAISAGTTALILVVAVVVIVAMLQIIFPKLTPNTPMLDEFFHEFWYWLGVRSV